MADNKKRKRSQSNSRPDLSTQQSADEVRRQLVGNTGVTKTKMPKLHGPFVHYDESGYASAAGNYLPSVSNYLDMTVYSPDMCNCVCFPDSYHSLLSTVCSCSLGHSGPVHTMSESDQEEDVPDLVPHPDMEDGEIPAEESEYYGVVSQEGPSYYADGGTVPEFEFQGGYGYGRHGAALEQDPSFLGVGESSSFYYPSSDQIQVFSQGGDSFYPEDSDFDGVDDDEEWQAGGPTHLDLELDNIGVVDEKSSNSTTQSVSNPLSSSSVSQVNQVAPVLPASFSLGSAGAPAIPTQEQVKLLLQIAKGNRTVSNFTSGGLEEAGLVPSSNPPITSQAPATVSKPPADGPKPLTRPKITVSNPGPQFKGRPPPCSSGSSCSSGYANISSSKFFI